tara:strand:- start:239 stop:376 length:138 start_codon:yes stop_codon:yes gene_type:complete
MAYNRRSFFAAGGEHTKKKGKAEREERSHSEADRELRMISIIWDA